ncbi:hypothetical protein Ae201684P_006686 [Aphanomyces euteiches]|nr:hypothetical protein Ae201684P_020111 [Aphanomyces euteiches]KAH9071869.1 hypothetical protein Ae201684P_020128 [Aphanomyces euteiches]KAH9100489.1 hypothetical protein Ae201684P_006686 [Aphanomyces euteiches]
MVEVSAGVWMAVAGTSVEGVKMEVFKRLERGRSSRARQIRGWEEPSGLHACPAMYVAAAQIHVDVALAAPSAGGAAPSAQLAVVQLSITN